jgi:hypothetical protein
VLHPYDITFVQFVMQRIHIIVFAVNNKVILHVSDVINCTGSIEIIAVDHAVDIHQSRSRIKSYVDDRDQRKKDREKICQYMLRFLLSVTSGENTGQNGKRDRDYQMNCEINKEIPHDLSYSPYISSGITAIKSAQIS